jgi:hypothetical protein
LSDPKMQRGGLRLYEARTDALTTLQREVDKRSRQLFKTIDYPMGIARTGRGRKRS